MRLPIAAALLTLVACARTTEGPTPSVTGAQNPLQPTIQPTRVCNAQGVPAGWRVNLSGDGFAPMPQDVLTDTPKLGMPEVTISGPSTVTLARERVFFVSAQQLAVDIPTSNTTPAAQLALGTYSVEVKNPIGTTGKLDNALLVVPPPTLSRVFAPEGFIRTAPTDLKLEGTSFRVNEPPAIVIKGNGLPTVTLTNVVVENATTVNAVLPPNTAPGTYDVVLTNPEGCSVTLPGGLIITYVRLGLLTIDPRFGWQRQNQLITIYNTPTAGTEELPFFGGSPEVFLVAPLKANPTQLVEIPLRRTVYVSSTIVNAVVPTCSGNAALPLTDAVCPNGIVPGGPYALKVRDTNGALGFIPAELGFTVLENPAPVITSISPESINTRDLLPAANPLVVTGQNFGPGAKVQLLKQLTNKNILACDLASTGTPSATELRAIVPSTISASLCVEYTPIGTQLVPTAGLSITEGLYVVRVQNVDNPAYANYSGLIVTNPSANPLHGPDLSSRLTAPRADFPLVIARDDLGQPYMYALGGTDGTNTLSSIEVAPVTLFGDLGGKCSSSGCTFNTLDRTKLAMGPASTTDEPRRGLTAVVRTVPDDTSYIFVFGGVKADGAAVNTVERAQVLRVADAPALRPIELTGGGNLSAGTYYYQVSAILPDTDPKNPGGETLPSDEYPARVTAGSGSTATLTWSCVPNATAYRIYRTVEPNAPSGTELLLEEVAAGSCSSSTTTETYTDDGTATPSGVGPLPPGALGRWVRVGTGLNVERGNAATRLVGDTVYVTGGSCSTISTHCTAPGTTLKSVERATFTAGTADLGAFELAGELDQPRQRHSISLVNALTAPNSFTTTGATPNDTDAWLLAVGGDQGTNASLIGTIAAGKVQEDGAQVTTPAFAATTFNGPTVHGGWSAVVANYLFVAGNTGNGTGYSFNSNLACPGTGNSIGQCVDTASFKGTLNSTGNDATYREGNSRYLAGSNLFRAFIYSAGGFPGDTSTTPIASIERIIY